MQYPSLENSIGISIPKKLEFPSGISITMSRAPLRETGTGQEERCLMESTPETPLTSQKYCTDIFKKGSGGKNWTPFCRETQISQVTDEKNRS